MSGFTPSPWRVEKHFANPRGPHPLHIVAGTVGQGNICKVNRQSVGKQAEANANLIAAAPELYEALVECREYVEGYEPYNSVFQVRQMQALAKLDAALARAVPTDPVGEL